MAGWEIMRGSLSKKLLDNFGQTYSQELGIKLKSGKSSEIFKWFLASLLFGKRIGENIAKKTYFLFAERGVLTPDKILQTGWDGLVKILDEGGYVRYDFSTADRLLEIMKELKEKYQGNLNKLHQKAKNAKDLEEKLQEFKGVGPVTTNIFLRELRGIWKKANPELSPFVLLAARKLKIGDPKRYWEKHKVKGYDFTNFEAALLRLGKDWFHKGKVWKP